MSAAKGYYAVIQYCPDLGRFEAANIGILLFCPERNFLRAMISRQNRRIKRFFGSDVQDLKRVNLFKRGLEDRLQKESSGIRTLEDLQQFIALRANLLQVTPLQPMRVTDPEADLKQLFETLIGEPAHTLPKRSFRSAVAQKLSSPALEDKVVRDIRVTVPILGREIDIPFGFQNGRFNLINPVRFTSDKTERSFETACKYGVEGQSVYEHGRHPALGRMQLVIVGEFRPKDPETPALVRRVLESHDVKLYSAGELPRLVEEIEQTGKPIPTGLT